MGFVFGMRISAINPFYPNFRAYHKSDKPKNIENKNALNFMADCGKYVFQQARAVKLKDRDGKVVKGLLVKPKSNSWYIKCNGGYAGSVLFSVAKAYIKGENYPESYKNRPYLFINALDSNQKYKGVGTELVKEVVRKSNEMGFDGHVCLNTTTVNPKLGSPVPFYYKLGFESSELHKQIAIEKAMKNNQKIPAFCESSTMFLNEESILKILSEDEYI